MKICIYGISGVYNYGCEAMVRSISKQLNNAIENCEIVYMTPSIEDDTLMLNDCETCEIREIKVNANPLMKRAFRFLRRKLHLARTEDNLYIQTDWMKSCDVLVVIGGDVFDLSPNDTNKKEYKNERVYVSKLVKQYGGKVVLWGISVGNFDGNKHAKKQIVDYFKNIVDYSIIRDYKSYEYLKQNGINNIGMFSDPAFMQRSIQTTNVKKRGLIGINLSLISSARIDNSMSENDWVCHWADVLINLLSETGFNKILLIPHVVNYAVMVDDDYHFLNKIFQILKEKNIDVAIVEGKPGFEGIKEKLAECDAIFSARMHCAINSITCGVPTLFLSYSSKSIGMCRQVYGNEKWAVDIRQFSEGKAGDVIRDFISDIDNTRKYLAKKNIELYEDACGAVNEVVKRVIC